MTPNDPKLSDGGGRQPGCGDTDGVAAAVGAAGMTPGAVRCSAWLGDVRLQRVLQPHVETGCVVTRDRCLEIDLGGQAVQIAEDEVCWLAAILNEFISDVGGRSVLLRLQRYEYKR